MTDAAPTPMPLTGLIGSHPLGALAAFGLLRWCAEIPSLRGARLHWELQDDWIAVLTPPVALDEDALCRVLLDAHAGAGGWPHLAGAGPTLRMPVADFRTRCRDLSAIARPAARFAADFAAGCGSDAIFRKKDDTLTPTRFDMTSAGQGLLKDLIKLGETLMPKEHLKHRHFSEKSLAPIKEALFGPWTYSDQTHPLGWDPNAERDHAFRAQKPESDNKFRSVRFAVWLGHFALAIFPSTPEKKHLYTTAFVQENYSAQKRFRWPLWANPIDLDTLSALITLPHLTGSDSDISELHTRGVTAIYESLRHDRNQGFAVFRPARLIPPGTTERRRTAPAGPLVF